MPKKKFLSKEQVLAAIAATNSNKQAARRLHVSYNHWKKYAKLYTDDEGVTLFEKHKNNFGTGIPKYGNRKNVDIPIDEIIEGLVDPTQYSTVDLKDKILHQGYFEEKCNSCGYNEQRVTDYKMPLLLNFKDNNKKNYSLDNIELLCYNCYFLQAGEIFTNKDLEHIQGHIPLNQTSDVTDFEVDSYMLKRFKELGISDEEDEDPDNLNELISRE